MAGPYDNYDPRRDPFVRNQPHIGPGRGTPLSQETPGGLLDQAALSTSMIPGIGDVVGLLSDANHLRKEPTAGNFGMSLLGALPFVPAMSVGRAIKKLDNTGQKNVWEDIPPGPDGAEWLKQERQYAAEREAMGFKVSGASTGGIREIELDGEFLSTVPGQSGEHLRDLTQEAGFDELVESIKTRGFDLDEKPLILVNGSGTAYISEGNHRIAAAVAAGMKDVPVEVRYFAGSQQLDGPFNIDTLKGTK